jgi:DNA topoisomerase-1
MEQTLDDIASGQADWLPYLRHFFLGEQGLEGQVKARELEIDSGLARSIYLENLPVKIGIGPYGPYVSVETESGEVRANLPEDIPPADLSAEHIEELIRRKQEGPKPIAFHPETQEPVYVIPQGPYGPYVQLGEVSEENKKPKRTSLPKGLKPEQVTPEIALGLLSLPRTLGEHPESGKKVQAGIGRFGPYVVCDGDFRSLPADEDVLTISLERALELLAQPKKGRGRGSAKPLRELGSHPEDGEPVTLHDGPYGLYVKHGKVNASLPKDLSPEAVTLEMALELLGSSAKGKGRSTGKAQAKASTTARKAEAAVPSAGSQKERTSQSRPSSNGTAKASHVQETAQTGSRPTILEVTPKARA